MRNFKNIITVIVLLLSISAIGQNAAKFKDGVNVTGGDLNVTNNITANGGSQVFDASNSNGAGFGWKSSFIETSDMVYPGNNLNIFVDNDAVGVSTGVINLKVGLIDVVHVSQDEVTFFRGIEPFFDSTHDLGTSLKKFNTVFGVTGNFSDRVTSPDIGTDASIIDFEVDRGNSSAPNAKMNFNVSGIPSFQIGDDDIFFYVDVIPFTDDSFDIGSVSKQMKNVFSVTGTFSGNLTANGGSQVWDASNLNGAAFDFDAKDITASGEVRAMNLVLGQISSEINTHDSALHINVRNADGSSTNFRDFSVRDGKFNDVMRITGSDKATVFSGKVTVPDLHINTTTLPIYADDTAAGAGGLVSGDVYGTTTGELRYKL
jgi:hypothetical protein